MDPDRPSFVVLPWRRLALILSALAAPSIYVLITLGFPADLAELLHHIGIAFGVAALTLLSASALCALRHPLLERFGGGLAALLALHHRTGVWAVGLIAAHVGCLMASTYLDSPEAALYLISLREQSVELFIGWISFALLALVVYAARRLERSSKLWRPTHLLSIPAYALALYHFFTLTTSSGAGHVVLAGVCLLGFAAGLLRLSKYAFAYRYRVESVAHIGDNIVAITLQPTGRRLVHQRGQFVFAAFHTGNGYRGCHEYHPFTITSAPGDANLELIVKARGDCSCALQRIVPGVHAHLEGPFGGLTADAGPQVWIGGGVGVTPFIPLLRDALPEAPPIDLYYVGRDESEYPLLPRLRSESVNKPCISLHPVISFDSPNMIVSSLRKETPDFRERSFLLAGPPHMVRDVRDCLLSCDVPSSRIRYESFGAS